ncbi:MAG: YraN family protein [Deltaproteobacteria bacterium]|nr:YraN family protein [Deltaproteobacteria bacterium]
MSDAELGRKGEKEACDYLIGIGYQIFRQNYRCQLGEVDIIALDAEYIVFIEVKTRRESHLGINPLLSVTQSKSDKIIQLCKHFLSETQMINLQPRFDVIGIVVHKNATLTLEHIKNAFNPTTAY